MCFSMFRRSVLGQKSLLRRGGGSSGIPIREPGGQLFGEAPVPAGSRRPLEDWELPYYIGFGVATFLAIAGLAAKPETSLKAWGRKEAIARQDSESQ